MRNVRLLAAVLPLTILGCTVGPDFRPPHPELPASFTAQTTAGGNVRISPAAADDGAWWTRFRDPELSALIEAAGTDNFDMRSAALRIAEARQQLAIAEADRLPSLNANLEYQRQRISTTTAQGSLFGKIGGLGSALPKGANIMLPGFPNPYDQYQVGFDASWEPDLFGRIRRSVEAATADADATVDDSREALVSLESEIARSYIDLRGAQAKLAIAQENLATERDLLLLTQQRRDAGLIVEIDVHNAAAQATVTESTIPLLEREIGTDINQMSLLLGREPGALRSELTPDKAVPPVPPEIGIGIPSELVRRRPDIRAAEERLHAATAQVGVATADMFPRLTLSAQFGTQSENFAGIADWASRFINVGPALQIPVFQGGRLKANVRLSDVREQEAAVAYEKTVVTALHDVENALVALRDEETRHGSLEMTVSENRIAMDLARLRYAGGLTTFLDVLNAQRQMEQNQSALADSTAALSTNAVALYKALGGGWQE